MSRREGEDGKGRVSNAHAAAVVVMILLVMIGLACVGRMLPGWFYEIFEVAR